jgi:L-aspartate oxidase
MTRNASVVRDAEGLRRVADLIDTAQPRNIDSRNAFEDAALTATASVVAAAALARRESRGCHHRADHPDIDPARAVSANVRLDAEVCC